MWEPKGAVWVWYGWWLKWQLFFFPTVSWNYRAISYFQCLKSPFVCLVPVLGSVLQPFCWRSTENTLSSPLKIKVSGMDLDQRERKDWGRRTAVRYQLWAWPQLSQKGEVEYIIPCLYISRVSAQLRTIFLLPGAKYKTALSLVLHVSLKGESNSCCWFCELDYRSEKVPWTYVCEGGFQ